MFKRIHDKLGTAGFVIAIVALVAALTGTAIAALPGLNSKQKKEVKNIAKSVAKAGPVGPAGAPGGKGDTGVAGSAGKQGNPGTPGTNGTDGDDGENGACSVGNPTCVLPPSATLTGVWSFAEETANLIYVTISYPLQANVQPGDVNTPSECPGTSAEPKAAPGYFCFYESQVTNAFLEGPVSGTNGASGKTLEFARSAPGLAKGTGTWAVTAPAAP